MYTEHLRIPVGSGHLHIERLGRGGPAIVLLHGFGTCSFLWRAVAPRLAEQGFTVVAIDLLGFGESDRPPDVEYGPAAQAAYVERALTALRLGDVQVVGQDLGALVALLVAARHPGLVRRLVLLEPLDPDDLPGPAIRSLQRTSALSALQTNALFGARPLLEPLLRDAVTDATRMPDRLVTRYLAPFVGTSGAAELLQLASSLALRHDDRQRLAEVQSAVLLWCGDGGGAPVPGNAAGSRVARWQQLLPAALIRPISTALRAGSLVAEETPDALASALATWVAYAGEGARSPAVSPARH